MHNHLRTSTLVALLVFSLGIFSLHLLFSLLLTPAAIPDTLAEPLTIASIHLGILFPKLLLGLGGTTFGLLLMRKGLPTNPFPNQPLFFNPDRSTSPTRIRPVLRWVLRFYVLFLLGFFIYDSFYSNTCLSLGSYHPILSFVWTGLLFSFLALMILETPKTVHSPNS